APDVDPLNGPQLERTEHGAIDGDVQQRGVGGVADERDGVVLVGEVHVAANGQDAVLEGGGAGVGNRESPAAEGAGDKDVVVGVIVQAVHERLRQVVAILGPDARVGGVHAEDAAQAADEHGVRPAALPVDDHDGLEFAIDQVAGDVGPAGAAVLRLEDMGGVHDVGRHEVVRVQRDAGDVVRKGRDWRGGRGGGGGG